jgi:hypothetical protein
LGYGKYGVTVAYVIVGPPLEELRFGDLEENGTAGVFATESRSDDLHQRLFPSRGTSNVSELGVGRRSLSCASRVQKRS